MLVLSRKAEQTVHIGPHITVTILRVKGGAVRIGVEAPPDVKILRGELTLLSPSRPRQETGEDHVDRAPEPAAPAASALPRRVCGPEGLESGEQDVTSTDSPPKLSDPRQPPSMRFLAPPGLLPRRVVHQARWLLSRTPVAFP